MNCKKCGHLLNDGDYFCNSCGEPILNQTQEYQRTNQGPMVDFNNPNIQTNNQEQFVSQQYTQEPIVQQQYNPVNDFLNNQNISTPSPQKSKKESPNWIIGMIVSIIFLALAVYGGTVGAKYVYEKIYKTTKETADTVKEVDFKGNKYQIPNKYIHTVDNKELTVEPSEKDWTIVFSHKSLKLDIKKLEDKENLNKLKQSFNNSSSYTEFDSFKLETINEVKLLTFKSTSLLDSKKDNRIGALIPLNNDESLLIFAKNKTNTYDQNLLKIAINMIKGFIK